MSRARSTAPKLAPALALDGPAPPAPMARVFHAPPRNWSASTECDRAAFAVAKKVPKS